MLNKNEMQLYQTVKKLATSLQHQCHLTKMPLDELIQVGCVACLEQKTKPHEVKEVAKKAILKYYYKERTIQKKQITSIAIGKNDSKEEKSLVEEVLPAREVLTDEEREEADKQQGLEWEDLPADFPEELKQDILAYRDDGLKGFWKTAKHTAYIHRLLQVAKAREYIKKNNDGLHKALQYSNKNCNIIMPYAELLLRKVNKENIPDNVVVAKWALQCPLIRKQLKKVDTKFNERCPVKRNNALLIAKVNLEQGKDLPIPKNSQELARFKYDYIYRPKCTKYNLKTGHISRKLFADDCPLIYKALEQYVLQKHHPDVLKKPLRDTKTYQYHYHKKMFELCRLYGLKCTSTTRVIVRSKCPLIQKVLINGILIKQHPMLNVAVSKKEQREKSQPAPKKPTKKRVIKAASIIAQLKEENPWLSDEEAEILGKDMYKKQKTKERAKREREILLIAREKIKIMQKT